MKTNVSTNVKNPKKAFDEMSLARVFVMATESLCPEHFESFEIIFNELRNRRELHGITERVGE